MGEPTVKGVNQSARRTWDKETFQKKAIEREIQEIEEIYKFEELKPVSAREAELNLEENVGKTMKLSTTTGEGGFYCEVCDCILKDSSCYLDHLNGKKHQRALGTSLNPERSTVEQVRRKLKLVKQQQRKQTEESYEERMERYRQIEERKKQEQKEKKKEEKKKHAPLKALPAPPPAEELDPAMASMGLPFGFGSTKK